MLRGYFPNVYTVVLTFQVVVAKLNAGVEISTGEMSFFCCSYFLPLCRLGGGVIPYSKFWANIDDWGMETLAYVLDR